VLSGRSLPENWRSEEERPLDLFDLKGFLEALGGCAGAISFRAMTHDTLPLALGIVIAGKPAGFMGQLSPADARDITVGGHQGPVIVAELDLALLQASTGASFSGAGRFGALPKFPAVRRDLALVLDAATSYSTVEETVFAAKEELLTGVAPFDIFRDEKGEKLPVDKKSVAVALTFQHAERTLTTEEVTQALGRIVTRLRESVGAEIRG
jgi:phenylalanyl-tRNA synthetase beta chain